MLDGMEKTDLGFRVKGQSSGKLLPLNTDSAEKALVSARMSGFVRVYHKPEKAPWVFLFVRRRVDLSIRDQLQLVRQRNNFSD
jgi:hypothetical protein